MKLLIIHQVKRPMIIKKQDTAINRNTDKH